VAAPMKIEMISSIICDSESFSPLSGSAPFIIALYYLMENPSEIKKAQEEIDRVVGDGKIDLEHLQQEGQGSCCRREWARC
jgi:hypothetical protein